jgi:hypothetical protein
MALAGLVDDERVVSIALERASDRCDARAVIASGTFLLTGPSRLFLGPEGAQLRLLAEDAAGTVIEDLPCSPMLFR